VLASTGQAILQPYQIALLIAAAVAALAGLVAFLGLKTGSGRKFRAAAPA
jgi:hypothetical protein